MSKEILIFSLLDPTRHGVKREWNVPDPRRSVSVEIFPSPPRLGWRILVSWLLTGVSVVGYFSVWRGESSTYVQRSWSRKGEPEGQTTNCRKSKKSWFQEVSSSVRLTPCYAENFRVLFHGHPSRTTVFFCLGSILSRCCTLEVLFFVALACEYFPRVVDVLVSASTLRYEGFGVIFCHSDRIVRSLLGRGGSLSVGGVVLSGV